MKQPERMDVARTMRALAVVAALGALGALGGGCSKGLSDAQRAELLGKIDAALRDGEAREAQRKAAVKELLARDHLATKPCTEVVLIEEDGTPRAANDAEPSAAMMNTLFAPSFEALERLPGRRLARLRQELSILRSQVEGREDGGGDPITPETVGWARERIARLGADWFPFENHLAQHNVRRDIIDPETGHRSPSHVELRAFVWDYRRGAVACQAEADKTLHVGDEVTVHYKASHGGPTKDEENLAWDYGIVVNAEKAVFRAMKLAR